LNKYVDDNNFFSKYDVKIVNNQSILDIPALSIILPFAWIMDADVHVKKLDKTFYESMVGLKQEYEKLYPRAPFNTKLIVEELVENDCIPDKTALLFSGGLDSTYSFYVNNKKKPRLVMIFGVADISTSNLSFQELLKQKYSDFASQENVKINFIRTNALKILDKKRIDHLWWKFKGLHQGDFWGGIGYALGHICQVAPLSINRFNHLLVAASRENSNLKSIRAQPHASSHITDEKIKWANLQVSYDGSINRPEKIKILKKCLHNKRIQLRVCWSRPEHFPSSDDINCSKCEKCLRTIVSLLIEGANPNEYGFSVNNSTLNRLKTAFEQKKIPLSHIKLCWKPLQRLAKNKIDENLCDSKNFFEWFRKSDLEALAASSHASILFTLYHKCPYTFSKSIREVFHFRRRPKPWYLF
jgi:hypothetical protein